MSRNATIVQVFVASPSDVQTERALLESLIAELNRTWSSNLGVMFELLKWETNVHPSFGADPQSVINDQIGDSYDVFIGILWGRFGTPTPRSLSGTAEEFERVFARCQSAERKPEVMIYFKDAPIQPSKIDPSQLKKVQDFRASLPSLGGVYSVFEDEAGFQSSLRAHLAALAQKFSKAEPEKRPQSKSLIIKADSLAVDEDDLGYLDYSEIFESRMAEMTSTLSVISEATVRIGEQIKQRAEEIQQLNATAHDVQTTRRFVKRAANDMNAYAEILSQQIPLMSSSRETALQALSRALTLYEDFPNTDQSSLTNLRTNLVALNTSAEGSQRGLKEFRTSVGALPRMTSDLNKAKRAVVKQLDSIVTEIDMTVHNVGNILESIDRVLHD